MHNKVSKKIYKRWWFWAAGIAISTTALSLKNKRRISNIYNVVRDNAEQKLRAAKENAEEKLRDAKENAEQKLRDVIQESREEEPEEKVSYKNFLKIGLGDSCPSVITLLGKEDDVSSTELNGIVSENYSWRGQGTSNLIITMENGIVVGKSQTGLGRFNHNVTLEKYEQIETGMTYDEVRAILGDGELTSHFRVMNTETMILSWINKNGSNMNCSFSGGRVMAKAQFNLQQ